MLGLIILIIVLACVLAMVPGIPPIGKTLLTIALIVLCALILIDVLFGLGSLGLGGGRLLHC